jgi:hypothetical protein
MEIEADLRSSAKDRRLFPPAGFVCKQSRPSNHIQYHLNTLRSITFRSVTLEIMSINLISIDY